MSMSKQKFAALQTLRERVENRARRDVEAKRRAEEGPRARALLAKDDMQKEVAARQTMSDRMKGPGGAPTSAADQINGRVLLSRQDQQVARSMQAAAAAADVLIAAVAATARSREMLRQASAAKEKSQQSAIRHAETTAMEKLKRDESELDEETEIQVMARFGKRAAGARHE